MKPISPRPFRAYDIRGIVDADFDAEWVERLGRACGTYLLERGIAAAVVGHDCRHSSPAYHDALVAGLIACGIDVVGVGMVPTPLLYFAVRHLERRGGIMITASHNPPEYNGFKIWAGQTTIHTTEIARIYEIFAAGRFASGKGVGCSLDIVPAYMAAVTQRIRLAPRTAGPLKVVVDGGNGAGGEICVALLRRLGVQVIEQYCDPDGSFPNHHPDPVVEANMRDLVARVAREGADLGIGLDGDADRLGVVDARGRLLFGDELLSLYARDLLTRKPGSEVLGDVKCSHRLFRDIETHGGKPAMWITGHSVMKARMLERNAPLAGEMSGHMFFNEDWYGFDDALYAAALLLRILSASPVPLDRLPGWPPSHTTPELHMPCPDEIKFAVIRRAQEHFRALYDVNEIDGARITWPDGWALARASNTQPVLVLRFEAETPERLAEIRALVETPLAAWIAEARTAAPATA